MTSDWRTYKLGEVCNFQRGLTYAKEDEVGKSNNAVLRANNIDLATNKLTLEDIRYISDGIFIPDTKKTKRGAIIICTASGSKSHLGKVALIDNDCDYAFGGFMGQIRPEPHIDSKFLFYVMTSQAYRDFIGGLSNGMNINNLKFSDLQAFSFSAPLLHEQRRIVSFIEEALAGVGAALANTERGVANTHELFQSYLSSVFARRSEDWTTEPLGKVAKFLDYRGKTPPKRTSGIRLITAKNVKMGYIQRAPEEFIDSAIYKTWMTRGFPKKGDVLFTTEAPLGNIAQLDTDEIVIIGQRLITLQPDETVLTRTFLKFALMSASAQKEISARGTGATVVGIKASILKQVPIKFPKGVAHQIAIVAQIERVSEMCQCLEVIYQKKLDGLVELKQVILHKAFAGKLNTRSKEDLQGAAA